MERPQLYIVPRPEESVKRPIKFPLLEAIEEYNWFYRTFNTEKDAKIREDIRKMYILRIEKWSSLVVKKLTEKIPGYANRRIRIIPTDFDPDPAA